MRRSIKEEINIITGEFEIDKRGDHLGAGLSAGVTVNGVGGKAIESAAEGAVPGPLVELAVGVEVAPAVLAPGKELTFPAVSRLAAELVFRGEWGDRHAPGEARCLVRVPIYGESREARPDRHRRLNWKQGRAVLERAKRSCGCCSKFCWANDNLGPVGQLISSKKMKKPDEKVCTHAVSIWSTQMT